MTTPSPDESFLAPLDVIKHQWGPIIEGMVAACEGSSEAKDELQGFMDKLAKEDDWDQLIAGFKQLLDGERDAARLLEGLDATDTVIISNVLHGLHVDVRSVLPQFIDLSSPPPAAESRQDLDLGEFIAMVAYACRPDTPDEVTERLRGAASAMANDPEADPALRALGGVLLKRLGGEADPDMTALPAELAELVRRMFKSMAEANA